MEIASIKEARKLSWQERWTALKASYFSDEQSQVPNWMVVGPALLLWSMGLYLHAAPSTGLWLFPLIGFSLIAISKWHTRGAAISSFALLSAFMLQGSESVAYDLFLFISTSLSLFITSLSLTELNHMRRSALDERETLIEERRLWKTRFETLSDQTENEKEEFDSSLEEREHVIQEYAGQITSLKNLVDLSNEETEQFIRQNKKLTEDNLNLLSKIADGVTAVAPIGRRPSDDEFLFGVKLIQTEALKSFVAYRQSKN